MLRFKYTDRMVDSGARFHSIGYGSYKEARKEGYGETCSTRLELESPVQIHAYPDVDTDGHTQKLYIYRYTWLNIYTCIT